MVARKPWGLKEWVLALSLFTSACTGLGFVAEGWRAARRGIDSYILDVVREHCDCGGK